MTSAVQSRSRTPVDAGAVLTLLVGLVLCGTFWWISWAGPEPITHVAFTFLWTGYILSVDGLVQLRGRRSLLRRAPLHLLGLFVLSSPVWWAFEGLNIRLQNWFYLGGELFSPLQYAFWATLAFSTVIPAVFETAELVRTFVGRVQWRAAAWVTAPRAGWWLIGLGIIGVALVLLVPRFAFPLVWVAPFLLFDGINLLAKRESLFADLARGDWSRWVVLAVAGLICGFFWEMWNIDAYPKWVYEVPFVGFLKVFEMPILGYGGYPPFAWTLFSFSILVLGVVRGRPEVTLR